jgi:hypothetical protein
VLSVTVPPALVSAAGDTIPFSQIRWTSSGIGDGTAAQSCPTARFIAGGTQFLADFLAQYLARELPDLLLPQ